MIDFLKYRYFCFAGSVVLLFVGFVSYFVNGGFKYHIDFVGGTEINIMFEQPIGISILRKELSNKGWKGLTIQSVGISSESTYKEFMIRIGDMSRDLDAKFKKDIDSSIKNNPVEIRSISQVGDEVGKDIRWNSFVAVILSLLIILLYVAIRSRYNFAIGAVVALAHDMLAVLVLFMLFGWQISVHVLAAVLAVLGYSINDTIVIFSRVNENLAKHRDKSLYDICNLSINQTITRTIRTSVSTLLTVGSILVLGGESVRGFALAMTIGVIFGTYSSIYIASPVMIAIGSKRR